MANGERWQNYWGLNNTIACPSELPFGTIIVIDEKEYICRDRGGLIAKIDNAFFWVDILTDEPLYPFGTVKEAYIVK